MSSRNRGTVRPLLSPWWLGTLATASCPTSVGVRPTLGSGDFALRHSLSRRGDIQKSDSNLGPHGIHAWQLNHTTERSPRKLGLLKER